MSTYLIYNGEEYVNQKVEIDSGSHILTYGSVKIDVSYISIRDIGKLQSKNNCSVEYANLVVTRYWNILNFISGTIDIEIDFMNHSDVEKVLAEMRLSANR